MAADITEIASCSSSRFFSRHEVRDRFTPRKTKNLANNYSADCLHTSTGDPYESELPASGPLSFSAGMSFIYSIRQLCCLLNMFSSPGSNLDGSEGSAQLSEK